MNPSESPMSSDEPDDQPNEGSSNSEDIDDSTSIPQEQPLHDLVFDKQTELKRFAKVLSSMATLLGPLAKASTYVDAKKALAAVERAAEKIPTEMDGRSDGGELLALLKENLEQRIAKNEEGLGRDLGLICTARGLKMRVLSREEPVEIRIPPFGIVIDRKKGEARIQFAREVIERMPAEADAIMDGYDAALSRLDGPFDAETFLGHCLCAWQAARAATAAKGDRVEVTDFLPYLALQRQEQKFYRDPTQKSFRDYTRVQFAWDVMRLREARMFVCDGWRLNIGAASGTSASNKARVIFMEDENGQGEYKLTVYFSREQVE